MYVRLWVEILIVVEEDLFWGFACVRALSACVCLYRVRRISMWVRVFTPWPQTGVLKPLWQCVQTAFSLLSPLSPSATPVHPRGHVLRHLHPGSVRVIFSPLSPLMPVFFFFPTHSSVLSSPNMLLDTPHAPAPSTPPPASHFFRLLCCRSLLSSWVQVCLINV